MTNPEVPGCVIVPVRVHPRAADPAAAGGHEPSGAGLARRSPLRHDMAVGENRVDFGIAAVRRPGDRVIRIVVRIDPVETERLEVAFGAVGVGGLRDQQRPGGRRKTAELHPGDILMVHAVVADVPAGMVRAGQEPAGIVPELPHPVRRTAAGGADE